MITRLLILAIAAILSSCFGPGNTSGEQQNENPTTEEPTEYLSSQEPTEVHLIEQSTYVSPGIRLGYQAQRTASSAYLECYFVKEFPEYGFGNFSFKIIAKENTRFAGKTVGKIGVRYAQWPSPACQLGKCVEIGSLDVDEAYRKNGYGEAATRTILGIFRSPKMSHLQFDRFWLTVGLGNDRLAARNLYTKIGFQVESIHKSIGFQDIFLMK